MTLLTIEIDTDDINVGYDGYGDTFESLFQNELENKITAKVIESITQEEIGKYADAIKINIENNVSSKFKNLLNEDIAITDRYGKPKFIGSVEDYIKKEIDDKYMHPVNTDGKRLEGCTVSGQTWVQWMLEKEAKRFITSNIEDVKSKIDRNINNTVNKILEEYADKKIKEKVEKKLLEIGVTL